MQKKYEWTNKSVLAFSSGADPVVTMENRARALALAAMDEGWSGPPFDPLALAQKLGVSLEARGDIPDARLVPCNDGSLVLQYNPTRPRGRLRFSIAHELAHTLFEDCADRVRHRGGDVAAGRDNWQLEVLCNIGAAELLMPSGSFTQLAQERLSIQKVMSIRKQYDVSVEACLIRLIKLARSPSAAFCASQHEKGGYKVDYVIAAPGYTCPVTVGQRLPADSVVAEANAIGFTSIGIEEWVEGQQLQVECVGLSPYPGSVIPRVVGLLIASDTAEYKRAHIKEVDGDALSPRGNGPRIIAHIVPDTSNVWGGGGFAAQLRRKFPEVYARFRAKTTERQRAPCLGEVYRDQIDEHIGVVHMVAQHGIRASTGPRLRYAALAECLADVERIAKQAKATVHMPRIGTGHGGASWDVVKELIEEELVRKGVQTTVYRLPV